MECADKREAAGVRGVSARCLEGGGRGGFCMAGWRGAARGER